MNRLLAASFGIGVLALIVGVALGSQIQLPKSSETATTTLTSLGTYTEIAVSSMTTTVTVTTTAEANTTTTTSTLCSVSGPTAGVLLHLVNETGGPVPGVPVASYVVGFCNNQRQVQVNPVNVTNSSGWADLRYGFFGNYYISIAVGFPLTDYNFTVPTRPLATSVVTYQLYSGNMTLQFCGYLGEPETQCGVV